MARVTKIMKSRNAFTLVELIVVLSILIALSGILLPLCASGVTSAAETATRSTLCETRTALLQYWHDTKLLQLDGITTAATESQRFDVLWLFVSPITESNLADFDPNLRSGWNGPYMTTSTADAVASGGPNLVDGWNQLLTVQYVNPGNDLKDVRIVSSGLNGVIDIPANTASSALTTGSIGDDIYVALMLR